MWHSELRWSGSVRFIAWGVPIEGWDGNDVWTLVCYLVQGKRGREWNKDGVLVCWTTRGGGGGKGMSEMDSRFGCRGCSFRTSIFCCSDLDASFCCSLPFWGVMPLSAFLPFCLLAFTTFWVFASLFICLFSFLPSCHFSFRPLCYTTNSRPLRTYFLVQNLNSRQRFGGSKKMQTGTFGMWRLGANTKFWCESFCFQPTRLQPDSA